MPICPDSLILFDGTFYTYTCIDCLAPANTSTRVSTTPLQCGCTPPNPDCIPPVVLVGGPGSGFAAPKPQAAPKKVAKPAEAAVAPGGFLVDEDVTAKGLAAPIPANFVWPVHGSVLDKEFDGERAYHVVKIGGADRYIRVAKILIASPKNRVRVHTVGKKSTYHPIPEVELNIGRETVLPAGVTPLKMVVVDKPKPGTFTCDVRRSGAKADPTVFHVILVKS